MVPHERLSDYSLTLDSPVQPRTSVSSSSSYLDPSNWQLDLDTTTFPNSPLGRSQEFNDDTHPHLELGETMTSLKQVHPGDQAWWHCGDWQEPGG